MRAVSLHTDVVVATSRVWQTTCTLVRGPAGGETEHEAFLIDSPVFPDELELLPALAAQASFGVVGLLATHGDWDHLLGPLAFAQAPLACAPLTATRLQASPGAVQRELRAFDDEHYVERGPLSLGSLQALDVPGRCGLGAGELELHPTSGHTADGMAITIPWARVLVVGDYLSAVEIPMLGNGGSIDDYLATLGRLGELVAASDHVVTGHGPVLSSERAQTIAAEDAAYLTALRERGAEASLPRGERSAEQRRVHERNVTRMTGAA